MLVACCTWVTLAAAAAPVLVQDPGASAATIRVEGPVELSPAAADAAALDSALTQLRSDLERRTATVLARVKPQWLPAPVARRLADEWLARQDPAEAMRVVDKDQTVRDHGSFASYQTELVVSHDERALSRMFAGLGGEMRRRGKLLAFVASGAAGLWSVLLLAYWWLDRITRGYMSWRLRFLCAGMGIVAPGIALSFV